ncbi:hypothetical protein Bhyg_08290 [Pseudolycoriella hygida]|uniref:Uncharacterized protein n=1 Tax=Pseudolycoriella hygida TaxID=35572 RepID=A0A9Q0S4N6_9DIPT|nr:hypothetical protein Bhyg_17383 [Pseudolycoriella hygida]KAJ6643330.1 hypothetical protein Bhyg_08290 [Pseudolycoriella hygida]
MKIILAIVCCLLAVGNAIPLPEEVYATDFGSGGPQPVDEVIAVTDDDDKGDSLKRVARHYGFGGISIGVGVPVVVPSYGYGVPVYGGAYPYYGGYGGYGGYRGYGYGYGYGRRHHHHHHYWR